MVNSTYMLNRKRNVRPQGMLFSDNPGSLENGFIVPDGEEFSDFIVLSDDNREPIGMSVDRIESRVRTVNGRMRSYHVADKLKIDVSWSFLPSRAFASEISFTEGGVPEESENVPASSRDLYTTDRGAGGGEILDWYEKHPGSFWVFLAYDKNKNFDTFQYSRLSEYNEVVEVFFSNFQYTVEKRGSFNHDFWTIDLSLEEV